MPWTFYIQIISPAAIIQECDESVKYTGDFLLQLVKDKIRDTDYTHFLTILSQIRMNGRSKHHLRSCRETRPSSRTSLPSSTQEETPKERKETLKKHVASNNDEKRLDVMYDQSSMYVTKEELLEMRERPPMAFLVQNASTKHEEVQSAAPVAPKPAQSWYSTMRVPLAHRKLVEFPEIFNGDPPFQPIAPRRPKTRKECEKRNGLTPQKGAKLRPRNGPERESASIECNLLVSDFVQKLREKNKTLFDRLMQRFAALKHVSNEIHRRHTTPTSGQEFGVEDAILFFLDAKHTHDVLYFKRKRDKKALKSSKLATYKPYDLERIDDVPRSGLGDYFMMTATSLVHHINNNDSDKANEVIALSQWIMESKMFSLLLAGIPLFQKFLVRKVFVGWLRAIRLGIYRDNCKILTQSLPRARHAFIGPLLHSCGALCDVRELQLLSLPSTRPAVSLATVRDHHKEQLAMAEVKLIEVNDSLVACLEDMVQHIDTKLELTTDSHAVYQAKSAADRHEKCKSVPIATLRQRKRQLQQEKDAAALDMSLLERYIRLINYMFLESLYLMLINSIHHLHQDLSTSDNSGAICVAVSIVNDVLELTPSLEHTKQVIFDGLARLVLSLSNVRFTQNAAASRSSKASAIVAKAFESRAAHLDLQVMLKNNNMTFQKATQVLSVALTQWFDRAAQQMLAFDSLRVVTIEVESIRQCPKVSEKVASPLASDLSRLLDTSSALVTRFLTHIAYRLTVLDRSQHTCQKLQPSWKVGFLDLQCYHAISKLLELIASERSRVHQTLYELVLEGIHECVNALQRATLLLEDRPQLLEFFCEQMKQVQSIKDNDKQLSQNIRNVDEAFRALKRVASSLGSSVSPQYHVMHQLLSKYTALIQSHAKFASKMLPNMTYQVHTALEKYSLRCQKLLRTYETFTALEETADMTKNVNTFQEVARELAAMEKATTLYQNYQQMVGLKVVEIRFLVQATTKWREVQELGNVTLQWLDTIHAMENGIFSDQNWEHHAIKVQSFLPLLRDLERRGSTGFASKMVERTHDAVLEYVKKLRLVQEMAQPWVKAEHWKEILKLLDLVDYVSDVGVLITSGYTVTLGFLHSRDVWKHEVQIREITQRAHHEAMTETRLKRIQTRLQDALLPLVQSHDSYDLDLVRVDQLLESFEDDLLTIQTLAQVTTSAPLQHQLVQWRDQVQDCQDVLDKWRIVQQSRTTLHRLFGLENVQQSAMEATLTFQVLDRKWRSLMHIANATCSLLSCLREVVTITFLHEMQEAYAQLWTHLGTYLDTKRRSFPRFNFVSDHDLFQLMTYVPARDHLPRLISKCFRELHALRMVPLGRIQSKPFETLSTDADLAIDAVYGAIPGDELCFKAVDVSVDPQLWMKQLEERVRSAMVNAVSGALAGSLGALFHDNFQALSNVCTQSIEKNELSISREYDEDASQDEVAAFDARTDRREWSEYPLQVLILGVHILVTHELSPLARRDRSEGAWQSFWLAFELKKSNLIELIRRPTSRPREKWLGSSILTLLLNKSHDIRDLYEEQPVPSAIDSKKVLDSHYSYAASESFAWIKMLRCYYETSEKKCTIHHMVKTFQYEYSFLSSYSCIVLSPLCIRTVVAMNSALALEHGLLVHSSKTNGCARKHTLVRDLAAMVGRECLELQVSKGFTLTYFQRILTGVLQSKSMWLSFSGLEVANMLRVFMQEMTEIVAALRAHHGSVVLNNGPVEILNHDVALIVTCSFDYQLPCHQQLLLRLTSSFVPVACPSVSFELLVDAMLLVHGFHDSKGLSLKLQALFTRLWNDPQVFLIDLPVFKLPLALAIVQNASHRLAASVTQGEEHVLVTAVWDEVHTKVRPESRGAVVKSIQRTFPHAADWEMDEFGRLIGRGPRTNPTQDLTSGEEEDERSKLQAVKLRIQRVLSSLQLCVTESYVRKVLELDQVVAKKVVVVVVGHGVGGKSTAIHVLSSLSGKDTELDATQAHARPHRILRLYPEAFTLNDIYGHVTGASTWHEGFFTTFFRQNGRDTTSSVNDMAKQPSSAHTVAPASWLVFDDVHAASSSVLEPLRGLMTASPTDIKRLTFPNGDQVECTHAHLRVFCEVESLEHWSPACLSQCGIVYMHREHMIPYTLLIKTWRLQQQTKRASVSHLTRSLELTSDFVAKLMRRHLPALLDVYKRFAPVFLPCSVSHAVANMLQLVTPFVDEVAKGVIEEAEEVEEEVEWMASARVIVVVAATMAMGMSLDPRARMAFHLAAITIAPHLLTNFHRCATLFDVGLRFEDHRPVLFPWRQSFDTCSRSAPRRSSLASHAEGPRRSSAIVKAQGRSGARQDVDENLSDDEMEGDISTVFSPQSIIYVPTAHTRSCTAWLRTLALAKANAFVLGASSVGKTLIMTHCLQELGRKERVSSTCVQMNRSMTADGLQKAMENAMTGKSKGVYCPGVGRRALVVLIENLNLETPTTNDAALEARRPCSAMIRQVLDGKGSFLRSTKEYVEFRDLAVWCSFSVSALGSTHISSRLLRHFHMMWLPDQTNHVFAQVVPMFTRQFQARYEGSFGDLTVLVHRLSQFPIQVYERVKKVGHPRAKSRPSIFSLANVLSVFVSLLNLSLTRVPANPALELEVLTLYLTLQRHRNRFASSSDRSQLESLALVTAKKLGFSTTSVRYLQHTEDYFFADCGDTEGITRVKRKELLTLFAGLDKTRLVTNPTQDDHTRHERELRDAGKSTACTQEAALGRRRSSLPRFAVQSGLFSTRATSAAVSFHELENTVDVYNFLQSGVRHVLVTGSETGDRRSTTMTACRALSFSFCEVTTRFKFAAFADELKAIVLETGLKATQTVVYMEWDDLTLQEEALVKELIRQDDLPPHLYSVMDKANVYALNHRGLATSSGSAAKRSFLDAMSSSDEKDEQSEQSKRFATSLSVHPRNVFKENVRRSLYIVLSISCKTKLLDLMTLEPSVYYHFVLKTFPDWHDVTAKAACDSALQDWPWTDTCPSISSLSTDKEQHVMNADTRAQWRDVLLLMHEIAHNFVNNRSSSSLAMRGRRYEAITTRFEDMLRVFRLFWILHSRKLQTQIWEWTTVFDFVSTKVTQINVRIDKEEIKDETQRSVHQSVLDIRTQLAVQEGIEQDARRLFLRDEEQCVTIQTKIEMKRTSIQAELAAILPQLDEATEALSQINKQHIVEMKSFTHPPQLVRLAMQAVCVLLDVPPTWSQALRLIADIRFLDRLRSFDKDTLTPYRMTQVKVYVQHPEFSMLHMKRASVASTTLCKWVLALVHYFEAMTRMAPALKELQDIEHHLSAAQERAEREKTKLIEIQVRLNELRLLHAQKLQRKSELEQAQAARRHWKSCIVAFGHVLQQWHELTRERLEDVKQQQTKLFHECAIVATLGVFGAELAHEERQELVDKCRQALGDRLNDAMIADIPSILQHWPLRHEGVGLDLPKVIVEMQEDGDEALATSLFLLIHTQQVSDKLPFLLDPLDRGVSWLKRGDTRPASNSEASHPKALNARQALVVIDAGDPLLIHVLETSLAHSSPSILVIENASEGDEASVEAALNLITRVKNKSPCVVYFAAKVLGKAASWSPKTWSHFALIDVTPTRHDLDQHFLALFCSRSRIALHNQREVLQAQLRLEKTTEDRMFRTFGTSVAIASGQALDADVSLAAASIVSAWKSLDTSRDDACSQAAMERITAQLKDFRALQRSRQELQERLRNLHEIQKQALGFAHRARAFVCAEEGLARIESRLYRPLAHTMTTISECLTRSLNAASSCDVHSLEPPTLESINAITASTTVSYIIQRLDGLPTSLHRTYLLLLVVAITDMEIEDKKEWHVSPFALTDKVRDRILRLSAGRSLMCHNNAHISSDKDVVKEVARTFVHELMAMSLAATLQLVTMGDSDRSWTTIDDELLPAFLKLQHDVLQQSKEAQQALYDDMIAHADKWKTYLHSVSVHDVHSFGYSYERAKVDRIQWPPWVEQHLGLLGQLQVHVTLFNSLPLQLLDDAITLHLGEDVVLPLLEERHGISTLESLARQTDASTPLLLLSDANNVAVATLPQVQHCAQRKNIPTDAMTFVSVNNHSVDSQSSDDVRSFHGQHAGSLLHSSVTRDVAAITRIQELSMAPGWTIVENATTASSSTVVNALRLEIARLGTAKSTNDEFRLWIVEELTRGKQDAEQMQSLLLVPAQRHFLEPPQTLRQHYDAFIQSDHERNEEAKHTRIKAKLDKGSEPSRPSSLSRPSSSIVTALERSSTEELQLRAALWLFHSIFRLHVHDPRSAIPPDLIISHYELDRAVRLIQLYRHHCVVAATVTYGASSLSQSSTAAVTEAQEKTWIELAALVYLGRQWGNVRAAQCRELLRWCLHSCTLETLNSDHETLLVSRIAKLRQQLVTGILTPCTTLFDRIELELVPRSLQLQERALESSLVWKNVAIISRGSLNRSYASSIRTRLQCAQVRLGELMTTFPEKNCLVNSVKQLEKQQRERMISRWKTPQRSMRRPNPQQECGTILGRPQDQFEDRLIAYLRQDELPAMEKYLTSIWTRTETILSLRAESLELQSLDMMATIDALANGDLPLGWTRDAMTNLELKTSHRVSTCMPLYSWFVWFQHAVVFFETLQESLIRLPPVRSPTIWLPALQRPKACLSSFRHDLAVNTGRALGEISYMVFPSQADARTVRDIPHDDLGSLILSGLLLSNANWSMDSCTLSAQDTASAMSSSGQFQPLPPLTVHATTRFQPTFEGAMLLQSTAHKSAPLSFYRCPLYQSPDHFVTLEEPVEFVYLPVLNAQDAVAHGVSLFIFEQ